MKIEVIDDSGNVLFSKEWSAVDILEAVMAILRPVKEADAAAPVPEELPAPAPEPAAEAPPVPESPAPAADPEPDMPPAPAGT